MFRFLRELLRPPDRETTRVPYVPRLTPTADGRVEQSFTATVVSVETQFGTAIALSDLIDQQTVHGILISSPESGARKDVELEYNDQGNSCTGADFTVEMRGPVVRILFAKDAGMFSGRIGVDPMDDSLPEEAMEYERPLAALLITVAAPDDVLVQVATALQQLSSCGVPVEIHLS